MIQDDRTPQEIDETIGFVTARDTFLSGWGKAKGGRSLIARPVRDPKEADQIRSIFEDREDFKYVKWHPGKTYTPRLRNGDHLRICNFNTFNYE